MAYSLLVPKRWERRFLLEVTFLALTVVFGLQLLRVLLNGLVFFVRGPLEASPAVPVIYALALFMVPFLAPLCLRAGFRAGQRRRGSRQRLYGDFGRPG